MAANHKRILQAFLVPELSEGGGYLTLPTTQLRNLDPFLLFHHMTVSTVQFPDHPHRGFESVVYVLDGIIQHEDCLGCTGETTGGGGQWFTAGKGIVHAEKLPSRSFHAIVVWVNLRSDMKFVAPAYQQFTMGSIKRAEDKGAGISATILAGSALGETADTFTRTPASFMDFQMQSGAVLTHSLPPGWNTLLYVLEGRVTVASRSFGPKEAVVLTVEEPTVQVTAEKVSRFILLSGQPLNEPCVQYGPFVMNTRDQIVQAFDDYHRGINGFEGAPTWRSQLFYGR
jgi:hypothetical protein